jgi:prepilin-type N-terminal cleavage/methylation domain-containing protein
VCGRERAPAALRELARGIAVRAACAGAGEAGFTLIEVLVSTLLVSLIMVATMNGILTTNKAAARGRARSEAQALAEQDEERLRGEPITAIEALQGTEQTRVVEEGPHKTKYTIHSKVVYRTESGTSSCASTNPETSYYETQSVVEWAGSGKDKVTATSSIAPPAGASLLVQVEGATKGSPVPGMTVEGTGPAPTSTTLHKETTTEEGCAVFGPYSEGGSFTVNVTREGYVDQNWYSDSSEDPESQTIWNLLVNVATKAVYRFAPAGSINVDLETAHPSGVSATWSPATTVPNVMVTTTEGMHPEARGLRKTNGSYSSPVTSEDPGVFPFTYGIYAGTCSANDPAHFGQTTPALAVVGGASNTITLTLPALVVKVYKGKAVTESELVASPTVVVEDTGCGTAAQTAETLSSISEIEKQGDLVKPGVPYGTYLICTEWTAEGKTYSVRDNNQRVGEGGAVTEVPLLEGENVPALNEKLEGPCP